MKVLQVAKSIWKSQVRKDANEETIGPTINLKEDFVPKKGRTYLMSRQKKEEVREFVEEQLRKGYIRPSKLPQTSPVFFVGKKDRKKRMVQDYWYLNKGTVKDNYPLPLISDLIDTMGTKRVFTKIDL